MRTTPLFTGPCGRPLLRWALWSAGSLLAAASARAGLSASISSPANSSVYPAGTTSISASFSASDNTSGRIITYLSATLDGSAVSFSAPGPSGMGTQSVSASANLSISANGSHTVVLTARDQDGTQATATSTFNVGKLTQANASTQNASGINVNTAWSPYEQGGSGSGGWQFCISGQTNFDGGVSSSTGTNLGTSGSPNWSQTWTTAAGGGTFTFYVVRDGDSNYNPSNYASGTLTLNAPVPNLSWVSINNGQAYSGPAGGGGSFTITANNTGTATWNSNYYLEMLDWNNNGVCFVPTGNVSPGQNASGTVSFTLPSTPGSYTYHFSGLEQEVEYFGPQPTITVTAMGNQNLSISPSSQTIYLGQTSSVNLSVSGGVNGYQWSCNYGGSVSPASGSSTTATFYSANTYTVTATSPSSTYYYAGSQTATINVVSGYPPPNVSYGSTSGTYAAAFSYQVSASNYPTSFSASNLPPGLSINNSGLISGTPAAAGSYSATVTARNSNGSGSNTISITIGKAAQTVVIEPVGPLNAANGQAITFSASGAGSTGSYVWGGSASGTGTMATVTFSANGQQTVTVYNAGDSNYLPSNTAQVTINVAAAVQDTGNATQFNVLVPTSTP